jgi:hypothetical protein
MISAYDAKLTDYWIFWITGIVLWCNLLDYPCIWWITSIVIFSSLGVPLLCSIFFVLLLGVKPGMFSWRLAHVIYGLNEEPARFIRYVVLASIIPNYPFSKVVFSWFLSQNNTLWHLFWKDFVHQCKVLDISSVFSMKFSQDAHIDYVFFCQNHIVNCIQIFLRFDVDRDKSDVMTSFGMIDQSAVFCVIMRAG